MTNLVVVGLQWGDEAKARIIDYLAAGADVIARYQGGSNAGHTVVLGREHFVFHLVPSGILRPGKVCVVGNGVVVDPVQLIAEIEELRKKGIVIDNNLFISDRAQVVMPYHKLLDAAQEKKSGGRIGTTLRGIGPSYRDKYGRNGVRMADIVRPARLKQVLAQLLPEVNATLTKVYGEKPVSLSQLTATLTSCGRTLKRYVTDTTYLLNEQAKAGKTILFEGAQGTLLDVDFGTYPFVTSSNPTTGGVCTGTGIPPKLVGKVVGVLKAYTTRVGSGPFPTELDNPLGQSLREAGGEYGATTGRPRRCGWLDIVASRYAVMVNGVDSLALTKLDVLSGQKTVKIATAYRCHGERLDRFPADPEALCRVKPVYEELPGWDEPLGDVRSFGELPRSAQRYVRRVKELLGVPVEFVSVGEEREQMIVAK